MTRPGRNVETTACSKSASLLFICFNLLLEFRELHATRVLFLLCKLTCVLLGDVARLRELGAVYRDHTSVVDLRLSLTRILLLLLEGHVFEFLGRVSSISLALVRSDRQLGWRVDLRTPILFAKGQH